MSKKLVFLEAISFAPQRHYALDFEMDPLYDKKGGPVLPSKDNSAPLHYSLYAQLMEGLFFSFLLKGHLTSDKLRMQNGFEIC